MSNQDFENEIGQYIKTLRDVKSITDSVLELSKKHEIVDSETEDKIQKYYMINDNCLEKLEKRIFEVAIIGLEKAGKSSFANALIEKNILPSKPGRCTFTSTQLKYGENDEAFIEFHTRNEFNKYIFWPLLELLKYPNHDKIEFDRLKPEDFEKYFKALEDTKDSDIYKYHSGKTDQDVIDIIEGANEIKKYLGNSKLILKGDEVRLGTKENPSELEKLITDRYCSRAVKKITIISSKLKEMKDAVIYDVPGFDSPTKLHSDQTEEYLKKADAIILVTNVGRNPNLRGTELSMLLKSDEDSVPLRDKLFIFGNQIDTANSNADAMNNIAILRDDAKKRNLTDKSKNRVIIGSAKAHLQKIGEEEGDGILKKVIEIISDGDGDPGRIIMIRDQLAEYYKNERFNLLKRRIDNNIEKLKEVIATIIKNNSENASSSTFDIMRLQKSIDLLSKIKDSLVKNLNSLREDLIKKILKEKYFSLKLVSLIDTSIKPITMEKVDEFVGRATDSTTGEINVDALNIEVRKELNRDFFDAFKGMVLNIANEKCKEIEQKILDNLLLSFNVNKDNPYFNEIKNSMFEEIYKPLIKNHEYNESSFVQLIERFSRDLFDVLILSPLRSNARYDKFIEAKSRFYSLAIFYEKDYYPSGYAYTQPLINIILTQGRGSWPKSTAEYIKWLFAITDPENAYLEKLRSNIESIESLKNSEKKELYFQEINKDITFLNELLKECVINAIQLEIPFNSTMTAQIDAIKDAADKDNSDKFKSTFGKYFPKYHAKLFPEEFDALNKEQTIIETRRKIIEMLQELMNKLESLEVI